MDQQFLLPLLIVCMVELFFSITHVAASSFKVPRASTGGAFVTDVEEYFDVASDFNFFGGTPRGSSGSSPPRKLRLAGMYALARSGESSPESEMGTVPLSPFHKKGYSVDEVAFGLHTSDFTEKEEEDRPELHRSVNILSHIHKLQNENTEKDVTPESATTTQVFQDQPMDLVIGHRSLNFGDSDSDTTEETSVPSERLAEKRIPLEPPTQEGNIRTTPVMTKQEPVTTEPTTDTDSVPQRKAVVETSSEVRGSTTINTGTDIVTSTAVATSSIFVVVTSTDFLTSTAVVTSTSVMTFTSVETSRKEVTVSTTETTTVTTTMAVNMPLSGRSISDDPSSNSAEGSEGEDQRVENSTATETSPLVKTSTTVVTSTAVETSRIKVTISMTETATVTRTIAAHVPVNQGSVSNTEPRQNPSGRIAEEPVTEDDHQGWLYGSLAVAGLGIVLMVVGVGCFVLKCIQKATRRARRGPLL